MSDLAIDIEATSEDIVSTHLTHNGIDILRSDIIRDVSLGKVFRRRGKYITIDNIGDREDISLIETLAFVLSEFLIRPRRVLVVGFGNSKYTCDTLGEESINNINIDVNKSVKIGTLAPRVRAVTGIESIDLLKGAISVFHPDKVIAIDTLQTSSPLRLGDSVQITDAGIAPGSGVGDKSKIITSGNIGIDLVAIGVPLLVSTKAFSLIPSTIDSIVRRYGYIIGSSITDAISSI